MGPFGSAIKVETFVPGEGVPVISGQHLHGFKIDETVGFNFISPEHADRLRNANVRAGDIVFAHRGNIGHVAYVPFGSRHERYVISQSYMRPNLSRVLPEFVVAYFKSPERQHQLLANASQVGVPSIARPVTHLRAIEIPLPPIAEQRAIAEVLGSLEDKIELNRRMARTLQELARAIFKSWFDLDPVRAKMKGREPSLPSEFRALFPDRLVESAIGQIPEAWQVGAVEDLALNIRHHVHPAEINEQPYVGLEHVPRRSLALMDWGTSAELESGKFAFEPGDVLFGKLRPYFHKVVVAPFKGVCSTDILVIRAKEPVWAAFVLMVLSSEEVVAHADAASTGTRMPRTNWATLGGYRIVVPPSEVVRAFQSIVGPIVERIVAIVHETRTLAAVRDVLLPRLVSGEVRISAPQDAMRATGG